MFGLAIFHMKQRRDAALIDCVVLNAICSTAGQLTRSNLLLWPAPRASGTIQLTDMTNPTGQWHAPSGCYGQSRRLVALL